MKFFRLLAVVTGGLVALADPSQVILIRHGEKPESRKDPRLTPAGRERAQAWSRYLGTCAPTPEILLAPLPTTQHPSVRPIETLEPLAHQLHRPIETPVPSDGYPELAKQLRQDARFQAKSVVICWVHQSLPQLARALGATNAPSEWVAEDYGSVWILKFPHDGSPILTVRTNATESASSIPAKADTGQTPL